MPRIYRSVFILLALGLWARPAATPARAEPERRLSPGPGVWVYRLRELDPGEVAANLQRRGVKRVFLSVPRSLFTQAPEKLHAFLIRAHQSGMEVHAMTLEDPSFVRQENHPKALHDVEALLAYCREHPDAAFDGIHLDAEPHVIFQGKGARTVEDWAANEALMKQYLALLAQTSRQVRASGLKSISRQPLRVSAAIAWWYNERAKDGSLPSGSAKLLAKQLDFVVPMVYDGIGGGAADVIRRVDDELTEIPTMIGVARKEYPSAEALQASIDRLNEQYRENDHYQGACVYEYSRWFDLPRKE